RCAHRHFSGLAPPMVLAILRADKEMNPQTATKWLASRTQDPETRARTVVRCAGQFVASASNQECSFSGSPTPTGLRLPAQGCEERATLGPRHRASPTPTELRPFPLFRRQVAATLSGL